MNRKLLSSLQNKKFLLKGSKILTRRRNLILPALAVAVTGLAVFSVLSPKVLGATSPVANAWNLVKDASNNLQFQYSTTGVNRLTVTSDGKVGINYAAPAANLQLNGFSQFSNGNGNSHIPYADGNIYLSAPNIFFRNGSNAGIASMNGAGGFRTNSFVATNGLNEAYNGQGGINTNYIHLTNTDTWLTYPGTGWNYIRGNTYAFNAPWVDENDGTFKLDPNGTSVLRQVNLFNQTNWAPLDIRNDLNSCGQGNWNCPVRMLEFTAFGQWKGEIYSTPNGTVYGSASDYRLKENIKPANKESALANLLQIPVREYRYKNGAGNTIGFVAHELQQFVPDAVAGAKDAVDENGNPIYQAVDYGRLTPMLTASVQELNKKIEGLEEQNKLLKALVCKDHPQDELCR